MNATPDNGIEGMEVCSDNINMGCKTTDAEGIAVFTEVADGIEFSLTVEGNDYYSGYWNIASQGENIELFTPMFTEMILNALSGGQLNTTNGQLFVSVQDDANSGVPGASILLDPEAIDSTVLYFGSNNMPDSSLTETVSGQAAVMNITAGKYNLVVEHGEKTCSPPKSLRTSENGKVNFDARPGYITFVYVICN